MKIYKFANVIVVLEVSNGLFGASQVNGEIIEKFSGGTSLNGNISFTLNGDLKFGRYNVYASQPDDRLYKGIENITSFETSPHVDLSISKSSDRDSYFVGDNGTFTIKVHSLGIDAHDVEYKDILPDVFEIIDYSASKGTFANNVRSIPYVQNSSETLMLKVNLTKAGAFINIVNVTTGDEDVNSSNNVTNKTVSVKNFVGL